MVAAGAVFFNYCSLEGTGRSLAPTVQREVRTAGQPGARGASNVKAEQNDVAVFHHIVLALGAHLALLARARKAAAFQIGRASCRERV